MKLYKKPFNRVKKGTKIIEVRLFDEKRHKLKLNDTIQFRCLPGLKKSVTVRVIGLLRYKKFEDLVNDFPASYFGETDKKDFMKRIYSFYTKKQEKDYSVLGIRIKT